MAVNKGLVSRMKKPDNTDSTLEFHLIGDKNEFGCDIDSIKDIKIHTNRIEDSEGDFHTFDLGIDASNSDDIKPGYVLDDGDFIPFGSGSVNLVTLEDVNVFDGGFDGTALTEEELALVTDSPESVVLGLTIPGEDNTQYLQCNYSNEDYVEYVCRTTDLNINNFYVVDVMLSDGTWSGLTSKCDYVNIGQVYDLSETGITPSDLFLGYRVYLTCECEIGGVTYEKGTYEVIEVPPVSPATDPTYEWKLLPEGGIKQVTEEDYEEPSEELEHELIQWIDPDNATLNMVKDHIYVCKDIADHSLTPDPDPLWSWKDTSSSTENTIIGDIRVFAGEVPAGWLACDGSAVSRTTYADLFACIDDKYGAGDGSTTFNLPKLNVGYETVDLSSTIDWAGKADAFSCYQTGNLVTIGVNFNGTQVAAGESNAIAGIPPVVGVGAIIAGGNSGDGVGGSVWLNANSLWPVLNNGLSEPAKRTRVLATYTTDSYTPKQTTAIRAVAHELYASTVSMPCLDLGSATSGTLTTSQLSLITRSWPNMIAKNNGQYYTSGNDSTANYIFYSTQINSDMANMFRILVNKTTGEWSRNQYKSSYGDTTWTKFISTNDQGVDVDDSSWYPSSYDATFGAAMKSTTVNVCANATINGTKIYGTCDCKMTWNHNGNYQYWEQWFTQYQAGNHFRTWYRTKYGSEAWTAWKGVSTLSDDESVLLGTWDISNSTVCNITSPWKLSDFSEFLFSVAVDSTTGTGQWYSVGSMSLSQVSGTFLYNIPCITPAAIGIAQPIGSNHYYTHFSCNKNNDTSFKMTGHSYRAMGVRVWGIKSTKTILKEL